MNVLLQSSQGTIGVYTLFWMITPFRCWQGSSSKAVIFSRFYRRARFVSTIPSVAQFSQAIAKIRP